MLSKNLFKKISILIFMFSFLINGCSKKEGKEFNPEKNKKINQKTISKAIQVDKDLKKYKTVDGIGGNLNSKGSDTLNQVMTFWVEGFLKLYPNVKIQVEGKGSGTAPTGLIQGTSQIGPMSRKMKRKELEDFEKKYGYPPTRISVALDSLAVYVNKDNPLQKISLPEIDGIFSRTRKGPYGKNITRWGQLGLKGEWTPLPISIYGRNSVSGTYGYFKKHALYKGDFKNSVKEQQGSTAVVGSVAGEKSAIGYSGIGYKTSSVKALALSLTKEGPYYKPNYQNVIEGKYPLGRMLYIYINKKPGKDLSPLTREFIKFIHSKEGQKIVVKGGYLPLSAKVVAKEQEKLK